ncbi:PspC domain protein [Aedoeadaptatus coxii]|uniref:PspC domain protein n=2 Tax=Aedoeadaptatus coxii TaxID=755172 RepID=A0A134AHY3_9FIRM|nr:PspC domain protein [Peptoniphilus coxii]
MMNKQLTRSITDRKIAGVCGGIAEYFGIDSNLVRILWVLFALGGGSGLLIYIICALLIPEEPTW